MMPDDIQELIETLKGLAEQRRPGERELIVTTSFDSVCIRMTTMDGVFSGQGDNAWEAALDLSSKVEPGVGSVIRDYVESQLDHHH